MAMSTPWTQRWEHLVHTQKWFRKDTDVYIVTNTNMSLKGKFRNGNYLITPMLMPEHHYKAVLQRSHKEMKKMHLYKNAGGGNKGNVKCVFYVSRLNSVFGGSTVVVELYIHPPTSTLHSGSFMWLHWEVTYSVSTLWGNTKTSKLSKLFHSTRNISDTLGCCFLFQDSGDVLWSYCRDLPFFSSPNGSAGNVVIGSVDGNICCLSSTGELVRIMRCISLLGSVSVIAWSLRFLRGNALPGLHCRNLQLLLVCDTFCFQFCL